MKRIATFTIFQVDQPEVWEAARRFAVPPHWRSLAELMFQATAEVGSTEYRQLREGLDALRASSGVESLEDVEEILDDADRAAADFVWILGVRVDRIAVKGRNGIVVRCPRCGSGTPGSEARVRAIREERLDGPAAYGDDELLPVPGGWDFVNLPCQLIVSERVTRWFREWNVTGWETLPVRSAATREPSSRAYILRATTLLPIPCLEHTDEEVEVCPGCGVVFRGAIREAFWMKQKDVGALSLWTRDASRTGELFLRREVADRLRERGANGLLTSKAVRVCDH